MQYTFRKSHISVSKREDTSSVRNPKQITFNISTEFTVNPADQKRSKKYYLQTLSFFTFSRLIVKPKILKEEFIACIREHERIIFKVCKMYCRTRDDEQDLFQDILLQLWKSFPSFKKEAKVSTWMYRVALNTAITQLRNDKRKPDQQSIDKEVLQIPNDPHDPKDENFEMMMKGIEKLSNVEKAIMVLYMEDHSYREMAEVMGMRESNIGFKINQIKSKLKNTVNVLNYGA